MQNRYTGDVGDFGKYALLKALAGDDLRLGVHWYLNADEESNTDGRFTDYPKLRECDPALYDGLHAIVRSGNRCVAVVFRRFTVRVYFVIPAAAHAALLDEPSRRFIDSTLWGRRGHFEAWGGCPDLYDSRDAVIGCAFAGAKIAVCLNEPQYLTYRSENARARSQAGSSTAG